MSRQIVRDCVSESVTITTSQTTTGVIDYQLYAGGSLYIVSGSITSLTWYGFNEATGTFIAIQELSAGAYVATTQTIAASKAYPLPDSLFGFPYLKAVGDAAGVIKLMKKT
jgi:hypothetical protein